jgi:hypothetical protein
MAAPRKTVDGGIETDTGVTGSTYKEPAKGMTPQRGQMTPDGVIGEPAIGQSSSAPVAAATPATFPATFPLKTAPAGTVTATGVTRAGYQEPSAGYTSEGGRITSTGVIGKTFGTPLSGNAVTALPLDTFSKDWRISQDSNKGFHLVAPNSRVEEGHTFVEGSNTTNATDAMWKFRGMRNTARNAAVKADPSNPAVEPEKPESKKEWTPMGFDAVANSRPAPVIPKGEKAKPNWWANLKGTSLDAPARLRGEVGGSWTGGSYNALNRKMGDQQTSFTDMQARALPDSGATGGSEEDLHKADLLARGETEQTDVINAQGQIVPQLFRHAPQFEEDQTMSAAKERRLMARSRKWRSDASTQAQWRGRVFNKQK